MLRRPPKPRRLISRWPLLLAIGLGLGTLAGLYVEKAIERAGAGGQFAAPVPPPLAPAAAKPPEEDREAGAALAAAIRADDPADCRALDSRHRSGCRDFVAQRARGEAMFDAPGSANQATASQWPATFD
jgi:hypothetical protein